MRKKRSNPTAAVARHRAHASHRIQDHSNPSVAGPKPHADSDGDHDDGSRYHETERTSSEEPTASLSSSASASRSVTPAPTGTLSLTVTPAREAAPDSVTHSDAITLSATEAAPVSVTSLPTAVPAPTFAAPLATAAPSRSSALPAKAPADHDDAPPPPSEPPTSALVDDVIGDDDEGRSQRTLIGASAGAAQVPSGPSTAAATPHSVAAASVGATAALLLGVHPAGVVCAVAVAFVASLSSTATASITPPPVAPPLPAAHVPSTGTATAARISRGSRAGAPGSFADEGSASDFVRDGTRTITVTLTTFFGVEGGVPSAADVALAVSELKEMKQAALRNAAAPSAPARNHQLEALLAPGWTARRRDTIAGLACLALSAVILITKFVVCPVRRCLRPARATTEPAQTLP